MDYPVTYAAEIPVEGRNRLTTLLRYFTAIPILIVAALYGIAAFFGVIVAWFSIVFTGRYPEGIYEFVSKSIRINSRANSYFYMANDEYPPFNGDEDPGYPVQVGIAPPLDRYSRAKTLFRAIIGIPVMVLAYVWAIILSVVGIIGWLAIVFTGKFPEGLVKPLHGALAYSTKATAYLSLVTEDYPAFSDEGDVVPAGQIAESKATTPA